MFFSLFFSCMHKPITPIRDVQRYKVYMEAEFFRLDNPEVSDTVTVDLQLSIRPQDRFSDDSVSYSVLVDESSVHWGEKEIESHLNEKWIEMRAFEFGELLSIAHMNDWSEEDEYITSFDILWYVMFPNPPNIDKGEKKPSLARYPLLFSSQQKGRAIIANQWFLQELKPNVSLRYEGKYDLRGIWTNREESSLGTIYGNVIMVPQGGIPQLHEGVLERDLCYTGAKRICQKQRIRFTWEQK